MLKYNKVLNVKHVAHENNIIPDLLKYENFNDWKIKLLIIKNVFRNYLKCFVLFLNDFELKMEIYKLPR